MAVFLTEGRSQSLCCYPPSIPIHLPRMSCFCSSAEVKGFGLIGMLCMRTTEWVVMASEPGLRCDLPTWKLAKQIMCRAEWWLLDIICGVERADSQSKIQREGRLTSHNLCVCRFVSMWLCCCPLIWRKLGKLKLKSCYRDEKLWGN